jgi:hypothetical protein
MMCVGAALLAGCAVVPASRQVVYARPAPAQPVADQEFDYTGESTPVEVAEYPDVVFYPRYDAVGCDCIVPVGFYNGVWINRYGAPVVYTGSWRSPPIVVVSKHLALVKSSPHLFKQMPTARVRAIQVSPSRQQHVQPQHPLQEAPKRAQEMPQRATAQPHIPSASVHQSTEAPTARVRPPAQQPAARPVQKKRCPGEKDPNKKEC